MPALWAGFLAAVLPGLPGVTGQNRGVVLAVPALSRVNPLPQGHHRFRHVRRTCGSGFTREEALEG
ncbi:protein of unknown function [Pseudomonas sp. JV551A1]|uniref:Uncharacterized protein n=1 Tax=Pseudomonas inefficax TaxID=2078786 RepID=A0AAQ1P486_9PSED|nr:protein of unknown function [Pseudomonas sp. JV551A1]SPO59497.1 protein of unknown function [Pseudomonas inefficax]